MGKDGSNKRTTKKGCMSIITVMFIISLSVWLYIFYENELTFISGMLGFLATGMVLYSGYYLFFGDLDDD